MNTKRAIKVFWSFLLAICITIYGNASGLHVSAKDKNIIPKNMAPGTVIQYDSDGKLQVVKEGLEPNDNLSKEDLEKINKEKELLKDYPISDKSIFLPEVQPGLTVFYDGLGLPTIIRLNSKPLICNESTNKKEDIEIGNQKNTSKLNLATRGFYQATGRVTWYNGVGKMGYDGKILQSKDCATKIGVDEPPAGTYIYVTKKSDNITAVLKKYDLGTLPNAILDVSQEAMNGIFKVKAGYTSSGVPYGEFLGYYFHD